MENKAVQRWTVLSNWISRLISIGIQLISIPILTTKLGSDGFAAYALICSLAAWFGLTDFGTGKSLQNYIGEGRAKEEAFGGYVTAAAIVLVLGISFLSTGFYFFYGYIAKFLFGNFRFIIHEQQQQLIIVCSVLYFGYMLGLVATQALYALGKGIIANIITIVNNACFIVALIQLNESDKFLSLEYSVIAFVGPQCIFGVISFFGVIITNASFKNVKIIKSIRRLINRGFKFSILSVLTISALNVDYIIMARTLRPDQITEYNILYRIFWVGMTFYQGLLASYWSLFTAWISRNEWLKVFKTIKHSILLGVGGVIAMTIVLINALPFVLNLVAPGFKIVVNTANVYLFAAYIIIRIWSDTFITVMQACNRFKLLLYMLPLQALISIVGQYYLSKQFGMVGILYGLIASYLFTVSVISPINLRKTRAIMVRRNDY